MTDKNLYKSLPKGKVELAKSIWVGLNNAKEIIRHDINPCLVEYDFFITDKESVSIFATINSAEVYIFNHLFAATLFLSGPRSDNSFIGHLCSRCQEIIAEKQLANAKKQQTNAKTSVANSRVTGGR